MRSLKIENQFSYGSAIEEVLYVALLGRIHTWRRKKVLGNILRRMLGNVLSARRRPFWLRKYVHGNFFQEILGNIAAMGKKLILAAKEHSRQCS